MAKRKLEQPTEEIDMTAMIDIIFLLIVFFILAGKITSDLKSEKITVPPTRTAEKVNLDKEWNYLCIDIYGEAQGEDPTGTMLVAGQPFVNKGIDPATRYKGYCDLRKLLDETYATAEKYDDPNGTGLRLPKVVVEIRGDSEAEYRLIQEIQQVLSDTIDPENKMLAQPASYLMGGKAMPFVNLLFTTRLTSDKKE